MRSALGRVARSARSLTSFHTAAAAAAPSALLASVASPPSPAGGAERPSSSALSLHPAHRNGLSPQQAFAAHSLAQLGPEHFEYVLGADGEEEEDEVVARLHEHLAAAFSSGPAENSSAVSWASHDMPAGMCAPPTAAVEEQHASRGSTRASLRACTQAVAARLTKQAGCALEPGTPHTLEGALQPSKQARVVVEAVPPFRVAWASPEWEALSGQEMGEAAGQPCLEVVQGHASTSLQDLEDALHMHARGTAELHYASADKQELLPVRCIATPLLDRHGSSTHMLLVFTPTRVPSIL